MARVAICIPSYKNRESLKRLLDSILEQDYQDYIVSITDDTDTEEIEELARAYQSDKLFYHKNKERLGATSNCNKSILLAQRFRPEYIKVMHHDDFFTFPFSLSRLVEMLDKERGSAIAFSGTCQVCSRNSYERCISSGEACELKKDFRYLYIANVIGAPSAVLIRNSQIYMDAKLKWLVDIEWYMRILSANNTFSYTCEPLVSIGVSRNQLTNECIADPALQIKEYRYVFKKLGLCQQQRFKKHFKKVVIQNIKAEMKKFLGIS